MAFFKKEFAKALAELTDKPEIYQKIKLLDIEIDAEIQQGKLLTDTDIENAAKQLHAKLTDTMNRFDEKTKVISGGVKYNDALQNFAEECHSAIYAHQPTLMAAPGLWNQIKAHINNFFEQYFAIKPFFNTDKSALGLKESFSISFNNAKDVLQPEEEDCCLSLR